MIDYGTRKCLVKGCEEDVPAPRFGRHVYAHTDAELATWPGGIRGVMGALAASLRESQMRADAARRRN